MRVLVMLRRRVGPVVAEKKEARDVLRVDAALSIPPLASSSSSRNRLVVPPAFLKPTGLGLPARSEREVVAVALRSCTC